MLKKIFICFFVFIVLFSGIAIAEGMVNINRASVKELCSLKGIGKNYAERIVKYRKKNGRFKKVEDLMKVKGIGIKIIEKNKGKITLK